jgi:hypothetical protein
MGGLFRAGRVRLVAIVSSVILTTTLLLPGVASAATYTYWFTWNKTIDNQYAHAYVTWTFYKIDGSSTNVFVRVQGSVNKKGPYDLLRFEPWLKRSSGTSTLGNWDPDVFKASSDGQQITFAIAYSGATLTTTFTGSSNGYQPYVSSTMYSLEWQGAKRDYNTLANNQVQRWYNFAASGMSWGICGKSLYYAIRTEYQWGDCGNRSH